MLLSGQVELIYKQERVASARESGRQHTGPAAHSPARGGPGRRVLLRDAAARTCHQVRHLAGNGVPDRLRAQGKDQLAPRVRPDRPRQIPDPWPDRHRPATTGRRHVDPTDRRRCWVKPGDRTPRSLHRPDHLGRSTRPSRPAPPHLLWRCPGSQTWAARPREELQTSSWSTTDHQDPARIVRTRHCGRCQPHTAYAMALPVLRRRRTAPAESAAGPPAS
ncbi:hypothetical protein EV649_2306 [Kribbella sp. VKM Ac-2569]|nr:hypothetical protein EV649_2306 [Kribbella sp. VKM Ac-2569]